MRIRTLVFDDDAGVRGLLVALFQRRGHEVQAFPEALPCTACRCQGAERCADIVISDVEMPGLRGTGFIENQVAKGCRVDHVALMSGDWSSADRERAQAQGCRTFDKPFDFAELLAWVGACERKVARDRILVDWCFVDVEGGA